MLNSKAGACLLAVVPVLLLKTIEAHPHGDEQDTSNGVLISACDPSNTTWCNLRCSNLHGPKDTYLADKCCVHAGLSASLLAFEEDSLWVPRLEEFNTCTGAKVRLEYLPEGEDGMADALRMDVGDDSGNNAGEGIFDAYLVQAPW